MDSTKSKLENGERRVFTVVFISLLLDLLAFTMILPLLPSLLDYYGHSETVRFNSHNSFEIIMLN